jgi:hypothetical protein
LHFRKKKSRGIISRANKNQIAVLYKGNHMEQRLQELGHHKKNASTYTPHYTTTGRKNQETNNPVNIYVTQQSTPRRVVGGYEHPTPGLEAPVMHGDRAAGRTRRRPPSSEAHVEDAAAADGGAAGETNKITQVSERSSNRQGRIYALRFENEEEN